jgi:hypothetical protein
MRSATNLKKRGSKRQHQLEQQRRIEQERAVDREEEGRRRDDTKNMIEAAQT